MHTSDPPASAALVTGLRAEALRLGFSRLGIAPATPPPGQAGFHDWLARGLAGATHEWLARHEPLRRDPSNLLPGARSVIALATDYPADAEPDAAAGRGRVASRAKAAAPPRPDRSPSGSPASVGIE